MTLLCCLHFWCLNGTYDPLMVGQSYSLNVYIFFSGEGRLGLGAFVLDSKVVIGLKMRRTIVRPSLKYVIFPWHSTIPSWASHWSDIWTTMWTYEALYQWNNIQKIMKAYVVLFLNTLVGHCYSTKHPNNPS